MRKVLVTGASGFIGAQLVEKLLKRGDQVRCLVRRTSQIDRLQSLDTEIAFGDVTDADSVLSAVRGIDTVFHVAGVTRAFRKNHFWDVNERGTDHVAKACAKQQTPPIHIYVSSIAASGPTEKGRRRMEADPAAPISYYGRSKLAGEVAATLHAKDVPTTIVRPGIVFGPHNAECFPIFQTIDRFGIHPVPGFRGAPLSYIHIDDLLDLLVLTAEKGSRIPSSVRDVQPGKGIYYATMDEHPSYAEFGRMIGRALGRPRAFVIPVAMPTLYVVASINELLARIRGKTDSFNLDKMREANVYSWACSSSQAQRELGYRSRASLEELVARTVEWYWDNDWLKPRSLPVSRTARDLTGSALTGKAERVQST